MGQGHIDARGNFEPTLNELHPAFIPLADTNQFSAFDTNWSGQGYEIPDGLALVMQDTNAIRVRINGAWVEIEGGSSTAGGDLSGTFPNPRLKSISDANYSKKTTNYTAVKGDFLLLFDTTSSALTLGLPLASLGRMIFFVKKITADVNAVTITPAGADTCEIASLPGNNINGAFLASDGISKWYSLNVSAATSTNQINGTPFAITSSGIGVIFVGESGYFQTVPMQADASIDASGNVTVSGVHLSTNTGLTSAGTTQSDALAVTKNVNEVTTTPLLSGLKLPTAVAGMTVYVLNRGLNTMKVYPATGAQINALGTNNPDSILTVVNRQYVAVSATQWYSVP